MCVCVCVLVCIHAFECVCFPIPLHKQNLWLHDIMNAHKVKLSIYIYIYIYIYIGRQVCASSFTRVCVSNLICSSL